MNSKCIDAINNQLSDLSILDENCPSNITDHDLLDGQPLTENYIKVVRDLLNYLARYDGGITPLADKGNENPLTLENLFHSIISRQPHFTLSSSNLKYRILSFLCSHLQVKLFSLLCMHY